MGWAPIRESLVAAAIYRSGIMQTKQSRMTLWDPFCGSGTIPLVASSMFGSVRVRQGLLENFAWAEWPIYKPELLDEYLNQKTSKVQRRLKDLRIFSSDIDLKSVNNCMENFNCFLSEHEVGESEDAFLDRKPSDQIFELKKGKVYVGVGDFANMAHRVLLSPDSHVTIFTNIPYLGGRSKDHIPLSQLQSIYKRFHKMVHDNRSNIRNVFVIVNAADKGHPGHFLQSSIEEWRVLDTF